MGVSVVVPHFGDPRPTLRLLAMLRDQATSHEIQVIVVDDGSPDPFPDTPGASVVRRSTNGGFGSAVNSGAEHAAHELLLVLNSDLLIEDSFVDSLVSSAQPWMPAVVSPWVTSPDGRPGWAGRHFPSTRHHVVEWLTPLARWRDHEPWHHAVGHDTTAGPGSTSVVDWVIGAALLMPTSEFMAVHGFDERFFMNSEEVDLQRRLRERGVPSVLVGTTVAVHEGGGSSDPERSRRWLVDSRLRYAEKWGHRRPLVVTLAAASALNFVWNAGRRLLGRPVHPVTTLRAELALLRRPESAARSTVAD